MKKELDRERVLDHLGQRNLDTHIERNLAEYREKLAAIEDLTMPVGEHGLEVAVPDQEKRRLRREVYAEHLAAYDQRASEVRRKAHERAHAKMREAFRVPNSYSQAQQDSYRDALHKLDSVKDREGLQRALARAHETGDEIMARAVLRLGYERQDEQVVGDYLNRYPDHRPVWDSFCAGAEEYNAIEAYGVPGRPEAPES
jgi:hypothetical protein